MTDGTAPGGDRHRDRYEGFPDGFFTRVPPLVKCPPLRPVSCGAGMSPNTTGTLFPQPNKLRAATRC